MRSQLRNPAHECMAQRLGERVRGPTEATGLYRAVLLRSGKWRQVSPAPHLREGARRAPRAHRAQPLASRAQWSFTAVLSFLPPIFHSFNYFCFSFIPSFLPTFVLLGIYS